MMGAIGFQSWVWLVSKEKRRGNCILNSTCPLLYSFVPELQLLLLRHTTQQHWLIDCFIVLFIMWSGDAMTYSQLEFMVSFIHSSFAFLLWLSLDQLTFLLIKSIPLMWFSILGLIIYGRLFLFSFFRKDINIFILFFYYYWLH